MKEQTPPELSRRAFVRRASVMLAGVAALPIGSAVLHGCVNRGRAFSIVGSNGNTPDNADWKTVMVSKDEPGEPLVVAGTIYASDGKTPLEGVRLHVYHTDARGLYSAQGGNGQEPVARLRGWMRTDAGGRYEFRTIKPAAYPGRRIPAHIHASASGAGYAERWIDDFWFEGDPLITDEMRAKYAGLGAFSPIMSAVRGAGGVLRCVRDIRLERK